MKISAVPSPATGLRTIRTWVVATSSSAHPVTAIEPATPLVLSMGVSREPMGGLEEPLGIVCSVTAIGPAEFDAPTNDNVMAAVWVATSPGANFAEIVRSAEPLPDDGETTTQGAFDDAVQDAALLPVCASRTTCDGVWKTNPLPSLTPLKINALLSMLTAGPVPACVIVNGRSAIVSVTLRCESPVLALTL